MDMEKDKKKPRKAAPSVSKKTKQGVETHSKKWDWVEASIWTDRMLAALENGVKGGKWFSLMDKVYARRTLEAAWQRVASNKGSAGIDNVSISRFAQRTDFYLEELSESLREGAYTPSNVKRVYIPKGKERRPLGIPTVKERIVQTALKMVLEPIFEHGFESTSYGFRPGLGCKDALRRVEYWLNRGYRWVVDADLKGYFDSIPQEQLMNRIEEKISDGRVLKLLRQYLKVHIVEGLRQWKPTKGTPQGAVISPLLANIYLDPLDKLIGKKTGWQIVRYADDFVILCERQSAANAALKAIQQWVEANGLMLHPEKTHVGDSQQEGQGFVFLGYLFEAGKRWVRKKSIKRLREKIRERTPRNIGKSMKQIIADLNPMLRGWFEYFKHAEPYTFKAIDGFVRRRLRSIGRRHIKKRNGGTGRCLHDHLRWPNTYFTELGLFTLQQARADLVSQSR